MINKLSSAETEEHIIQLLQTNGQMTTKEITIKINNLGLECYDEPVRVLNKLKIKGTVKGKLSIKKRGWIWWV
jgi:hypothetical protein